jgi:hypothetical protein
MPSKRTYVFVIGIAIILSVYSVAGQVPNPVPPGGQRAGGGRGARGPNDPWPV